MAITVRYQVWSGTINLNVSWAIKVSNFHDILLFYSFDLEIINQHKKVHTNIYYPICFNPHPVQHWSHSAPHPVSSKIHIHNRIHIISALLRSASNKKYGWRCEKDIILSDLLSSLRVAASERTRFEPSSRHPALRPAPQCASPRMRCRQPSCESERGISLAFAVCTTPMLQWREDTGRASVEKHSGLRCRMLWCFQHVPLLRSPLAQFHEQLHVKLYQMGIFWIGFRFEAVHEAHICFRSYETWLQLASPPPCVHRQTFSKTASASSENLLHQLF